MYNVYYIQNIGSTKTTNNNGIHSPLNYFIYLLVISFAWFPSKWLCACLFVCVFSASIPLWAPPISFYVCKSISVCLSVVPLKDPMQILWIWNWIFVTTAAGQQLVKISTVNCVYIYIFFYHCEYCLQWNKLVVFAFPDFSRILLLLFY